MEAEFDSIDTNEGGMILFQEFTNWAFSKNFDLEDDIDSQAEVALINLLNRTNMIIFDSGRRRGWGMMPIFSKVIYHKFYLIKYISRFAI